MENMILGQLRIGEHQMTSAALVQGVFVLVKRERYRAL